MRWLISAVVLAPKSAADNGESNCKPAVALILRPWIFRGPLCFSQGRRHRARETWRDT